MWDFWLKTLWVIGFIHGVTFVKWNFWLKIMKILLSQQIMKTSSIKMVSSSTKFKSKWITMLITLLSFKMKLFTSWKKEKFTHLKYLNRCSRDITLIQVTLLSIQSIISDSTSQITITEQLNKSYLTHRTL